MAVQADRAPVVAAARHKRRGQLGFVGGVVVAGAAAAAIYLVMAPVHLDLSHPLLAGRTEPVFTHHEAVRRLLERKRPRPIDRKSTRLTAYAGPGPRYDPWRK